MMMLTDSSGRRGWMLISAASASLMLTGCYGFTTYPPVKGQLAWRDPDATTVLNAFTVALADTIERGPATGPHAATVAVSLPKGVSRVSYQLVIDQVNDRLADENRLVIPWEEDLDPEVPVYAAAEVKLRLGVGEVLVFRPVDEGASAGGTPELPISLSIDQRSGSWRVTRRRAWALGSIPAPELNSMPPDIMVQREIEAEQRAAAEAEEAARAEQAAAAEAERRRNLPEVTPFVGSGGAAGGDGE